MDKDQTNNSLNQKKSQSQLKSQKPAREVSLKLPRLAGPLVRGFEDWAKRSGHKLQVDRRNGFFIVKVRGDVQAKLMIKEVEE